MGKGELRNLQQQQSHHARGAANWPVFCQRCCPVVGVLRILELEFTFRCVFVLLLSLSLLLSGIFWIFRFHSVNNLNSFDAEENIKLSATIQAYFRLEKPVSQLVRHIERLEFEIFDEIGVPETKVAILSMHQSNTTNRTDVIFGILSEPINKTINMVHLSLLRSSLLELYFQQSNLTLTTSIFGQPSVFEILKFPGGITVIPMQYRSIWQMPQIFFYFTLNNSISEILDASVGLKKQLEDGLHLWPYEYVVVQLTNSLGSTIDPPVTVQVSVLSALGVLMPQRLKQLAQIITNSGRKNLGLDNSVFGEVKGIMLSSYLRGTLHATPPTASPAPAPAPAPDPDPNNPSTPSYPAAPTSLPTAPGPAVSYGNGCRTGRKFGPPNSSSPVNSPPPPIVAAQPPTKSPSYLPSVVPPSRLPPELSPLPGGSYDSSPEESLESPSFAPSPSPLSSSSPAVGNFYREMWLFGSSGLFIFHLFCWPH